MNIRAFDHADAAAIADIYNYYIAQTAVTFEEAPIDASEIIRRANEVDLPWLVLQVNDQLVGYCYARPWSARSAYKHSVETSIYLSHAATGSGYGGALLRAMLKQLSARALHTVIAGIALPNDASIALHEKLGFNKVAQFQAVGFKQQHWVDVAYWQLMLESPEKRVVIRDYCSKDAPELTDIFYQTIHERGTDLYSAAEVQAWAPKPINYEFWQQRLDALPPYIAEVGGVIAGFITLTPEGHIEWTYTHKDFMGQGIASTLLAYLEQQAIAKGLTVLTVDASRFARPMFEKFAYEVVRRNLVERHGETLENWSMKKCLEV